MADPWAVQSEADDDPWAVVQERPAKPKAKKRKGGFVEYVADEIGGTVAGAARQFGRDVRRDLDKGRDDPNPLRDPVGFLKDGAEDIGSTGRMLASAGNLALSPVTGAVNAFAVRPLARGLSALPIDQYTSPGPVATLRGERPRKVEGGDRQAENERIVGNAFMALGPGKAPARAATPRPSAPNRLATNVESFDRAGVRPSLAATGGGRAATSLANTVAENPIAGVPTRGRLRGAVEDAEASAGRLAARYGETRGAQITGENVQSGVQRFARDRGVTPASATAPAARSSFSAKADRLYEDAFAPIEDAEAAVAARAGADASRMTAEAEAARSARLAEREALVQRAAKDAELESARRGYRVQPETVPEWDIPEVSPTAPRPIVIPTQTGAVVRDIAQRVNSPALSRLITDKTPTRILKALEEDASNVRFNDLRELRTWVRTAQRDETLRQGITRANLQRLEAALTEDIYNATRQLAGEGALARLMRADRFYKAGVQRIDRALESFDAAGSGESAYTRVVQAGGSTSSADAQKLLSLKRSLNAEEWGDVAANIVAELGKPTAGAAQVGEPGFSISTFVTNYNKLSPRGRDILFGPVGGGGAKATRLQAELDNLARVIGMLKEVEKGANTSKTFVNAQAAATVTGAVIEPVTTASFLGAFALAGEMLTNPVVVRWLARLGSAKARGPGPFSAALKNLAKAANDNAALMPLAVQARALAGSSAAISAPIAAEETPDSR